MEIEPAEWYSVCDANKTGDDRICYIREKTAQGGHEPGRRVELLPGRRHGPDTALERGTIEKMTERIAVPASYNDQKDKREYRNHCGWVFYQRQVTVPAFYRGQRLFLRMDAVTNNALVWLDGSLICEHRGGFLPFEVEITGRVLPGEAALLTIAADNRISHSTLPVGNEGTLPAFFGFRTTPR